MLDQKYKQLVHYIEGMIEDGCQLVIGGNLLDWNDTNIPNLLAQIKEEREDIVTPELKPGDHIRHKISGQDMWVINDDGKTVYLNPDTPTIRYPADKILNDFEIVKKAK